MRERLGRYHRDADAMFIFWSDIWLSPAFRGWTMEPLLRTVRVPTLAIQGFDDSHDTIVHLDTIAARAPGPVRLLKLKQCGHDPLRDQPETTLSAYAKFLLEVSPSTPMPESSA